MSKIWHSTNPENIRKIYQSGYLRKGSYVTAAPIKKMTSSQRTKALCLPDDKKGKRVCECDIDFSKLRVPPEGFWTCNKHSQFQLTENLPTDDCLCDSAGGNYGKVIAGILISSAVVGGILWYIHRKKTVKTKRLHKKTLKTGLFLTQSNF